MYFVLELTEIYSSEFEQFILAHSDMHNAHVRVPVNVLTAFDRLSTFDG